jgi:hypothetical protein
MLYVFGMKHVVQVREAVRFVCCVQCNSRLHGMWHGGIYCPKCKCSSLPEIHLVCCNKCANPTFLTDNDGKGWKEYCEHCKIYPGAQIFYQPDI